MANNSLSETSENKSFIIAHGLLLREYANRNQEFYGAGIVVVNLLLLKAENIENIAELNLLDANLDKLSEPTVHQPISYIPHCNFWFKTINLKIKKKHQINMLAESNADKIFVVFIKDDAIEYFSIYTIKNKKAPKV